MARKEARIQSGIWAEPEWRALSAGAQWLYLFLISQPDIAHDGVISLRERRWAQNATEVTPGEITRWLKELGGAGYVVVDETTEEVMVRSFMRHDQVYLQPNLMASAVAHLPGVESRRIRRAIYSECSRIIRENSDRARSAAGERALTEKQKIPIRQMITILRATGDAEMAIEQGPAVRPTEVPAGATVVPETHQDDLRSVSTEVDGSGSNDLRSVTQVSETILGQPWVKSGSRLGQVDTEPYDADDPLPPAGLNPSGNPTEKPLGDRGTVTVVPTGAPIPYPLSPTTTNGHDLRSSSQGDLLAALPGRDAPSEDPLLDEIGVSEPERMPGRLGTAFDRFWAVYPLKVKKGYARQCWDRALRRAKVSPETIIRGAVRYRDDPNRSDEYTAHPSSWLNQDRWDDAPLPPRARTNGRPAPGANARAAVDIAEQRRARRVPGGEITDGRR
jgi:hypothetical protein